MASYSLIVRKSVCKDIQGIPKDDVRRILACIAALADTPPHPAARNCPGKNDTA
jgi:hypothetical protein